MTGNSWLMLIVLAGVGAAMEPKLTPYLLNLSEANLAVSQKVVKPDLETPELVFDLSAAKSEDFPKYFIITEDWVASTNQGELMSIKSGSEWKYDHHHNEIVYFKGLDGITGNIHIGHTDMLATLKETLQQRSVKAMALKNAKAAKQAEQTNRGETGKGEGTSQAAVQPTPPEQAASRQQPETVKKAPAEPKSQVAQIEQKESTSGSKEPLSPEQIVELMKSSVGHLSEFSTDQVVSWSPGKDGKDEAGDPIQTGDVVYSAETLFGKKEIRAQAVIKNGIVEKWIWPTSGFEIH